MAAFEADEPGYRLVRNGFVTLVHRRVVLAATLGGLSDAGYAVVELETSPCRSVVDLLDLFAESLDFPDYFGRNLDALNDCLRDVAGGSYGWPADATGLVLVLQGYDAFVRRHPRTGWTVLDIVADRCREAALLGRRMLCLVQSDDPDLQLDPVGATPVRWDDAEQPRARRVTGR